MMSSLSNALWCDSNSRIRQCSPLLIPRHASQEHAHAASIRQAGEDETAPPTNPEKPNQRLEPEGANHAHEHQRALAAIRHLPPPATSSPCRGQPEQSCGDAGAGVPPSTLIAFSNPALVEFFASLHGAAAFCKRDIWAGGPRCGRPRPNLDQAYQAVRSGAFSRWTSRNSTGVRTSISSRLLAPRQTLSKLRRRNGFNAHVIVSVDCSIILGYIDIS